MLLILIVVIFLNLVVGESPLWIMPCHGCSYTSGYGKRNDYVNYPAFHDGSDFAANSGTGVWVLAMASGIVTNVVRNCREGSSSCPSGTSEWSAGRGSYGNSVTIQHNKDVDLRGLMPDWETNYNHLASVAVSVGDRVYQGQVVGRQGQTGSSRGVHVHVNSRPANWTFPSSNTSPGGQANQVYMGIDLCSGIYRKKRSGTSSQQLSSDTWAPFADNSRRFVAATCPAMYAATSVPSFVANDPAFPKDFDCHADGSKAVQGNTEVGWGRCEASSKCSTFSVSNRCPSSSYRCCIKLNRQSVLSDEQSGQEGHHCAFSAHPNVDAHCFSSCPEAWKDIGIAMKSVAAHGCMGNLHCCARETFIKDDFQLNQVVYRSSGAMDGNAQEETTTTTTTTTIVILLVLGCVCFVVLCVALVGAFYFFGSRRSVDSEWGPAETFERHRSRQATSSTPPTSEATHGRDRSRRATLSPGAGRSSRSRSRATSFYNDIPTHSALMSSPRPQSTSLKRTHSRQMPLRFV